IGQSVSGRDPSSTWSNSMIRRSKQNNARPTITARRKRRVPFGWDFLEARSLLSSDLRSAVIGDYGGNTAAGKGVATMVHSWQPAFVTTVGDNNYPDGLATTIDENIGQ